MKRLGEFFVAILTEKNVLGHDHWPSSHDDNSAGLRRTCSKRENADRKHDGTDIDQTNTIPFGAIGGVSAK
jgi:hypothetical protein